MEPTDTGDRLRLRTVHASARMMLTAGVGILAVTGVVSAVTLTAGIPDAMERVTALAPMAMAIAGVAALGIGVARLRGWAQTRLRQMDEIAERMRQALGKGSASDHSG